MKVQLVGQGKESRLQRLSLTAPSQRRRVALRCIAYSTRNPGPAVIRRGQPRAGFTNVEDLGGGIVGANVEHVREVDTTPIIPDDSGTVRVEC